MAEDRETLIGGVFVGSAEPYDALRPLQGRPLPAEPARYLSAAGGDAPETELPDDAILCSCNGVPFGEIRQAVRLLEGRGITVADLWKAGKCLRKVRHG